MLPAEFRLDVRSRLPARATRKPPLLFVHGGYCDAWCWEPYFLPWFAARGWPAHALSLRGHGNSGGQETLFVTGIDDYVADVEHVAGQLGAPPVLIGHSMGAAICERMVATRPVRGAALLAPVPPGRTARRCGAPGDLASDLYSADGDAGSDAAINQPAGDPAPILFLRSRRPDTAPAWRSLT